MNQLIHKNFSFLKNEDIILKDKDTIIKHINKVHSDVSSKEYGDALSKLRIITETIMKEYLLSNDSSFSNKNYNGLYDIIEYMKNTYSDQFSNSIYDALHFIRKIGNPSSHDIHSKAELSEAIMALRSTRDIIWFCYKRNDELELFDEETYYPKNSNESKKIIDIIEPSKEYSVSDISLNKIKLREWMVLKETIIIIPIYQRGYSWTEDQIEVLFDDIKSRADDGSTHYFGIIAGKKSIDNQENGKTKIKIIDGQQRLTTSFLFFCAVRDIMEEKFNIDIKNEYYLSDVFKKKTNETIESYFDNPGGDISKNETFRKILKGDYIDPQTKNEYFINYNKFKTLLSTKECNPVWLRELTNTFLNKFELANISFDIDHISNKKEMEIFENLNSKGRELSIEELIKNFIFNLCTEEILEQDIKNDIPKNYNAYIIGELIQNKKGDIENVNDFYSILIQYIQGTEIPQNKLMKLNLLKDSINKLFNLTNEFQNIEEYNILLFKMRDYANIFYDIFKKNGDSIGKWMGIQEIIKLCADKNKLKLFVGLTYLTYEFLKRKNLYDVYVPLSKEIKKQITELFLTFMKFMTKNAIVANKGDSSFKKISLWSINLVRNDFLNNQNITIEEMTSNLRNYILKKINTDNEFKISLLNNTKNNKAMKWLLVITDWNMKQKIDDNYVIDCNTESYVEHIFPPIKYDLWKNEMKNNSSNYNEDEFNKNKDKCLENIGNYIMIDNPKMKKTSNELFSYKKHKYDSIESQLYNNSFDKDIDISKKTAWTFNDINLRTEKLVNYICLNVIKDNN